MFAGRFVTMNLYLVYLHGRYVEWTYAISDEALSEVLESTFGPLNFYQVGERPGRWYFQPRMLALRAPGANRPLGYFDLHTRMN